MVNDPQLLASGSFIEFEHPEAGMVKYPGAPYKFSSTPWEMRRPAPLLGQDNEEIYGRLGYAPASLSGLRRTAVI
jgi:crotonobetainyl-CoA:carnitine CoA-transferase CaiB-like acyl-CoA transferase